MRRVLIACPVYDWRVDVRFAHSLTQTVRMAMQRGIELRELFEVGDALIQNARNSLVKAAIEHGFDDLVFIDSDQDWEPEWVFRLLDYPVDCVGAAVRRKTDDVELYNVKAMGGPHTIVTDPKTGLMTAPDMALGTGFLRLSRRALQALWDTSEPYTVFLGKDTPSRWIFDVGPRDTGKGIKELMGEDTMVSEKLRALGIQTWLDPAMTCGHMGWKRYSGDFKATLEKWRAEDQAA